jgi:hypothetical protein
MPFVQGGPPEWTWERTADALKWQVTPRQDPKGHMVYELRVNCGLEILRLHFITEDELKELQSSIDKAIATPATS